MECFLVTQLNFTADNIETIWFQYLFHLGPQHLLVNQTNVNQANTTSLESRNISPSGYFYSEVYNRSTFVISELPKVHLICFCPSIKVTLN